MNNLEKLAKLGYLIHVRDGYAYHCKLCGVKKENEIPKMSTITVLGLTNICYQCYSEVINKDNPPH